MLMMGKGLRDVKCLNKKGIQCRVAALEFKTKFSVNSLCKSFSAQSPKIQVSPGPNRRGGAAHGLLGSR
jgi:hypothetical protein